MIKQKYINNIFYSIIGFIFGILLCFANAERFIKTILICIGIFVILMAIPGLLVTQYMNEKEKNESVITSIITIIIGALLVFFPSQVIYFIVGALLIVFPIIRILSSSNKNESLKKELVKIVLGSVVLLCGFGVIFKIILIVIGVALIILSLLYFIYSIINLIKLNKNNKGNSKENDVIDV